MIDTFLKYLQYERRYSPKTLISYKTDLRQFAAFLKQEFESKTEDANYGMIRGWIVSLSEKDLDASSINRKIACLRSYFKFLRKREIVTKDPLLKIRVLKVKKKLPHFVNEKDLIDNLDNPVERKSDKRNEFEKLRDQLTIEMLYGTGMRLSELIGLRDKDVNFGDRTIKVLGKRNKERVIPFAAGIVSLLERYRDVRNREVDRKDPEHFFVTKEGKKLYPVLVYRIVKVGLAGTNVEKKSPHVLRHTYATHLLNKGAEINAVKDLLGHTSLAATQVYTHNTMEKLKEIFDQAHPKA
ncbi:MAG TPA: tyrosine-type recombinase/integrase [Cyclobacteriaceae bacterium]|nr:tyrosine-type recombinase/integrase [Cyclobacteriaceae bacterium]